MTDLYVADPDSRAVFDYAYPTGGTPVLKIKFFDGYPFGTAVIPSQHPSSSQ
jgi:hypothetical protein